jgi:hypothetical protein
MTESEERLIAVQARLDQINALVAEIRNDPAAHAALADRLIAEYFEPAFEEIDAEFDAIETGA